MYEEVCVMNIVYMCMLTVCMQRSEDNFVSQLSFLPLLYSRDQTQGIRFVWQVPAELPQQSQFSLLKLLYSLKYLLEILFYHKEKLFFKVICTQIL